MRRAVSAGRNGRMAEAVTMWLLRRRGDVKWRQASNNIFRLTSGLIIPEIRMIYLSSMKIINGLSIMKRLNYDIRRDF